MAPPPVRNPQRALRVALIALAVTCAGAIAYVVVHRATHDQPGTLTVEGVSVDQPVNGQTTAIRMMIDNQTDAPDRLVEVSADAAGTAVIHQSDRDAAGRTIMRARSSVAIPPGRITYFAPGLMHVMLTDLRQPLKVGDTVHVVLRFEHAGTIEVDAPVRPIPTN